METSREMPLHLKASPTISKFRNVSQSSRYWPILFNCSFCRSAWINTARARPWSSSERTGLTVFPLSMNIIRYLSVITYRAFEIENRSVYCFLNLLSLPISGDLWYRGYHGIGLEGVPGRMAFFWLSGPL